MLKQKLQEDQISALKSHNKEKLSVVRFLLSRIKNEEIKKGTSLSDEEIISLIRKIKKEIEESISYFKKANRNDLIEENEKQLEIISLYLPEEISDEQLKKEIENIICQNKDLFKKNPNTLIGICIRSLKSKADSSRIIKIIKSLQNDKN